MRLRAGWLVATTRAEKNPGQKTLVHGTKLQVTGVYSAS
jgi:hypothetical protein